MILLIDDLSSQAGFTKAALQRGGIAVPTHHLYDVGGAIAYLEENSKGVEAIVLDVYIRGKINAAHLVKYLKKDKALGKIPLILVSMHSLSDQLSKLLKEYDLSFVLKSENLDGYALALSKAFGKFKQPS